MLKNRNKFLIFITIMLISFSLSACVSKEDKAVNNNVNDSKTNESNEEYHSYTDALEREVMIPNNPKRVLALNSSMIESLFNLGVTPIGVVDEYSIPRANAENLPSISMENSPNIEIINELKPDLIIAHVRNHAQMLDSLEATGAVVVYVDPSAAEDQLVGSVNELGEILNCQDKAEEYEKSIMNKSKKLKEEVKKTGIKTALFIQGGNQSITAARSFCFWGRLLTYLGLENIVSDDIKTSSKAGFITFDIETITQKDPDVIFVLQPGFRKGEGKGNGNKSNSANGESNNAVNKISSEDLKLMYENDPMWKELSAVKNGRLIIVPENISPGKIEAEEALDVMAKLVCDEN
ncbi:ABC transporter substrate-binding protein [Anaerovorax odorimutans]|uniref:ABC transporter substrate-binding protein n=1 Tax=Anaerovorax odorimutans TaxID=109327 RepID=UPI0003F75D97|nr:ABC transporter substrate-binding protein [Anaerovorax odorimutans]